MNRLAKRIVAAAAAVVSLVAMTGCGSSSEETSGPKITIGIKFDQPGVGYKQGNEYTGFDVDVARYVAKKLGYSEKQIIWKEAPSAQREALLQNGDVDFIAASYSITEDRKKVVDFAGPYFYAGQDLLVRSDDTSIKSAKDLNGKNLCTVSGSTSAQVVKDNFAKSVQIMELSGYAECVTALISGTVDAVTTDDIILAGLASAKGGGVLKVLGQPFTKETYGIGVKKGSTQLIKQINDALAEMVSDGSWQKALDAETSGTDYSPNKEWNPPTKFDAEDSDETVRTDTASAK
ncbi:MAG: glutamate ABC transporter substrate-binding protein [Bifidobacteriaceae bacterium]|jgi:glutamate transport system substrate-binding protein|nr:glutamate ABC transporter substrate-binding protein [Bifidobacteriaceae bacterium]MCI1978156.1 glutamate ABC transporter substrate-binding protein [Bifidobacteriaceae bacterium]